MCKETEITLEIRDDILKLIKAKLEKHGCSMDELVNYFLTEVVRTKMLPFDESDHTNLPPIVSSEELTNKFEEIVDQLLLSNDVIYVSHDSELSCVIMTLGRYEAFLSHIEPAKDPEEKERE